MNYINLIYHRNIFIIWFNDRSQISEYLTKKTNYKLYISITIMNKIY